MGLLPVCPIACLFLGIIILSLFKLFPMRKYMHLPGRNLQAKIFLFFIMIGPKQRIMQDLKNKGKYASGNYRILHHLIIFFLCSAVDCHNFLRFILSQGAFVRKEPCQDYKLFYHTLSLNSAGSYACYKPSLKNNKN